MLNAAPQKSTLFEGEPAGEILFRRFSTPSGVEFDIAYASEADDPFTQAVRLGFFPTTPSSDLLFALAGPGDRFLDLGANIGQFALSFAALGCQVLGVEASARNAELLRASIARNHFDHLHLAEVAASDAERTLRFSPRGLYGHVHSTLTNLPTVEVRATTVDRLLEEVGWERVDCIKMDIEGSEIAAVRGMARLLSRDDAPPIVYESNGLTLNFYNQTVNQLRSSLEAFGYRNYLIEPGRLVPVRAHDIQPIMVADHLAVKRLPAGLHGWEVSRRRSSRKDRLAAILRSCASTHEQERAHVARALRNAPAWLLSEPMVQDALAALRADTIPLVKEDAAWSRDRTIRPTLKQRLVYGLGRPLLRQLSKVRDKGSRLAQRMRRSA